MRLHRFIRDFNLKVGELRLEDKELLNQCRSVLKLKVGEKIILCDGHRNEGLAEIKEYGKDFVEVAISEVGINKNEPERHVILYCAILKRENFELVVQKATEIGVKEIVPIVTERTVKLNIRPERLEKIIKEAAEQSGRGVVPVLHKPVGFDELVKHPMFNKLSDAQILFDTSGESFNKLERLNGTGRIGVWVGPEGGWTDKEIELARGLGFKIINLGKLTLRAETAAIVGSYLIINS